MTVITVARQLGSFGDWIAEQLAAKLDYEFIDRRLVEEIASITETSVEEVERYDEKGEGRLRFFLKKLLVPEVAPGTFPLSAAAYAPEFGLEFPHMREPHVSIARTSYSSRCSAKAKRRTSIAARNVPATHHTTVARAGFLRRSKRQRTPSICSPSSSVAAPGQSPFCRRLYGRPRRAWGPNAPPSRSATSRYHRPARNADLLSD